MKRNKNTLYLYLCEGECEVTFINQFRETGIDKNKNNKIFNGRVKKFNLFKNSNINIILNFLQKSTIVIIVCDIDTLSDGDINNFKNRLNDINVYSKDVLFVFQNSNFEECFSYSIGIKSKDLSNYFKCSSNTIKKEISNCNNLYSKCNKDINFSKYGKLSENTRNNLIEKLGINSEKIITLEEIKYKE